jgi:hypothetical protein
MYITDGSTRQWRKERTDFALEAARSWLKSARTARLGGSHVAARNFLAKSLTWHGIAKMTMESR